MQARAPETVSPAQAATLAWVLGPICDTVAPPRIEPDPFAPTWKSVEIARFAVEMTRALAGRCRCTTEPQIRGTEVICSLEDARARKLELRLGFESASSGRLARLCVLPVLDPDVEVRVPQPADLAEMTRLELSAPVRRADGTEVLIGQNGQQFARARVISDHRWLAAFRAGRMLAVQGVTLATAPVAGKSLRIAYNHYSRSDPSSRQSGNLIHLVSTLYWDIYPRIDQFISLVDVQNPAGMRLSFGQPWPTRVRRLFLPVESLAQRHLPAPARQAFDADRAAALLNATHQGMDLWVPRTGEFLLERVRRAPRIYGDSFWRMSAHAVLGIWSSGERRSYRTPEGETNRTLALALDYGFEGETGRLELTGLLHEAATELQGSGISHIAIFISDNHPPCDWLAPLAGHVDTYAVCAPPLGAVPSGPVYVDQVVF